MSLCLRTLTTKMATKPTSTYKKADNDRGVKTQVRAHRKDDNAVEDCGRDPNGEARGGGVSTGLSGNSLCERENKHDADDGCDPGRRTAGELADQCLIRRTASLKTEIRGIDSDHQDRSDKGEYFAKKTVKNRAHRAGSLRFACHLSGTLPFRRSNSALQWRVISPKPIRRFDQRTGVPRLHDRVSRIRRDL